MSEFEDSIRRQMELRKQAESATRPLVPNITRPPQAYAPDPYRVVPNVMRPDSVGAPIALSSPGEMERPQMVQMGEETPAPPRPAAPPPPQATTQNPPPGGSWLWGMAPGLQNIQGGGVPQWAPPEAEAPPAAAPEGPSRQEQIDRLVAAGDDPETAARVVDRQTEVSGPMPAGLWQQNNSPERIRDLRRRIAEGRAADGRMDAFEQNYNAASGAPSAPSAPRPQGGLMAGEIRVRGGRYDGVEHGPSPERWLREKREAEAAENWEQRGVEVDRWKKFDDQIEAKRQAAIEALPPEAKELLDFRKSVGKAWGEYQRNFRGHQNQGTSFKQFLATRGLWLQADQPGHAAIADHYLMLEGNKFEQEQLREGRRERVRSVAMERAGNGAIAPHEVLDDPRSTHGQRMNAYTALIRVNPRMADEYRRMAELENNRLIAQDQAKAAADLKEFDKKPPPEDAPPPDDRAGATDRAIAGMPEGGDFDTVVTNLQTDANFMPHVKDADQRQAAATNYLQSRTWAEAQYGPLTGWMRSWMRGQIYADPAGTPSDKPMALDSFIAAANGRGVGEAQARAIYTDITSGPVPNNHAEVGVPDPPA
jgi:hypothetical protein